MQIKATHERFGTRYSPQFAVGTFTLEMYTFFRECLSVGFKLEVSLVLPDAKQDGDPA